MRIGHGFDIHRLKAGRRMILGGVDIPFEKGLDGHSDADCLLHAITDALLGAASLPDIGRLFPDTDLRFKDIDSSLLLVKTVEMIREKSYRIVNIDSTIICQKPKLAPYVEQMRSKIASYLSIEADYVNIKAKTAENLGEIGQSNAVACFAVCLIDIIN